MSATLDLKKVVNALRQRLSRAVSPKQMGIIGRYVAAQIKDRSREGLGVSEIGGSERRFPKLSKEYIKQRQRSRLSPFTTPSTSNITRTGQLLASIRYTVNTGSAMIRPVGGRSGSDISNEDLASIVQNKLKRPFMALSKRQIGELLKFFEANIFEIK